MSAKPTKLRCSLLAALMLASSGITAAAATSQNALFDAAQRYFPSDANDVPPARIFRLTRDQLDATVANLLPALQVPSVKTVMAKDPLQTNYEYADLLSFNAANIRALSGWTTAIAAQAKAKPAAVINCAASNNDDACLKTTARAFIVKAFRGDVKAEQINRITSFFVAGVGSVGFPQATADLVEIVLNSPSFLFREERQVDRNLRLAPPQLLQALTYTIGDAPPAALGFNAETATPQSVMDTATVNTILASKQSREKLLRFFNAWLEIKAPEDFTISQAVFPQFNAKLGSAMRRDTDQFLRAALSSPAPKLKDITQATQSFVSKELEDIYATVATDPAGKKPAALDPAQRFGIFTSPALLASHSGPTNTRPIKRGVFWVRKVLCMELDPPPNGIDSTLDETAHTTERSRIEKATNQTACIGCHKVIEPLGFFQENYDALGKWRTTDNGFPVNARVAIDFLDEGPVTVGNPVDALRTFTNSLMFKQCFVRQMFRYYMGRNEEPADDRLLRRMFIEFAKNDEQDILSMIRMLATSERIVRRQ
jgi:Protein of unknown function (DUF1588)/Protein of unknown function (DUF1592)/Protein of unknown function (DUF1595)/Protein of unknown function (DUF1585)